jgi:hypothetical protein
MSGPLHDVVKFVTKTFLDEEHYTSLHRTLSNRWDSHQSLSAAVKLMEQYGVTLTAAEQQRMGKLDEATMIDTLVQRMPQQSKEQFEHFFLQLQLIVSTATRVRTGLEVGSSKIIEDALNDADETGITSYILKMTLVQAGSEVTTLRSQHDQWCREINARMSSLLTVQDDAMQAQKQLAAAQAQLGQYAGNHKDKAKKALMGVAGKNDKALMGSSITEWFSYIQRMKKEAEIRKEYEDRIDAAQQKLYDYKMAQKGNASSVLLRQAAAGDSTLVGEVFSVLIKEVTDKKLEAEAEKKLAEIEAKLAAQSGKNKDNAKSVLMRNLAANDNQLCDVCIEAWKQFIIEYKKNKEEEVAVKEQEKKMADFMKNKSEGAKGIIDKMNAATDSGLVEHVVSSWVQLFQDNKKAAEMERMLMEQQAKFASFSERNKKGAGSAGSKAAEVRDYGLINHGFILWAEATKVERLLRYYQNRVDAKKHQLSSLQGMFRSFATQLETGMKDGTPRDGITGPKTVQKRLQKGTEQTVSLPSIHKTPTGSHRSSRGKAQDV